MRTAEEGEARIHLSEGAVKPRNLELRSLELGSDLAGDKKGEWSFTDWVGSEVSDCIAFLCDHDVMSIGN